MERKIIMIMLTLVVVAIVVVGVVMVAAVGIKRGGGFTQLFDQLEDSGELENQYMILELPSNWDAGDVKSVSDTIVDMYFNEHTVEQTTVYVTTLYFVYTGNKWNNPDHGTMFRIPIEDDWGMLGWKSIVHGLFWIQVSSATNLSAEYDIGDVIELETTLVNAGGTLAFSEWSVSNTL